MFAVLYVMPHEADAGRAASVAEFHVDALAFVDQSLA
ncbi:uncharacterized protein CMC5_061960 [Chondromyces crocatus]|uniref:YCII-related domain-containing protein n=1 Tax=Chondromyces crocatus TaxID=52 RepID=A0A0K1EM83_CHOCO|nr:uncharacterized protein CMC5_061960 [Chondromyces crocatus]